MVFLIILKIFYSLGSNLAMLYIMKWAKWFFTTAVVNVQMVLLLWKQEKNPSCIASFWLESAQSYCDRTVFWAIVGDLFFSTQRK